MTRTRTRRRRARGEDEDEATTMTPTTRRRRRRRAHDDDSYSYFYHQYYYRHYSIQVCNSQSPLLFSCCNDLYLFSVCYYYFKTCLLSHFVKCGIFGCKCLALMQDLAEIDQFSIQLIRQELCCCLLHVNFLNLNCKPINT